MNPRDWLHSDLYGNSVVAWLTAGGVLVGGTVLLLVLRRLIASRLAKLAARTATDLDDLAVDLVKRTRAYFLFAVALVAGTLALDVPDKWDRARHVFIVIAVLLQLGVWGNGLITYWLERYMRRTGRTGSMATTLGAIGFLGRGVLWLLLVVLALDNLGFHITTLVTGLGIGGVAIALAVQNILGDLFGALAIFLDKPFVVGDTITVEQFTGTVEHIGLKTTRLRALSGEQIVIANSELLKARIRNYQSQRERRQVFTIGVGYDTPPEKVERIPAMIREIVQAQPLARMDRAHFSSFLESSLQFETVYYVQTADYAAFMDTQQAINLGLMRRFAAEGIRFAVPTRTVVVRGTTGETTTEEEAAAGA